ncbi:MAG: hypothetical protein QG599_295 [Pseudomonadota bacterium]|nr:hypothetical protein [Pseudomonadota bacterium]
MDKKISGFSPDLGLQYVSRYDGQPQNLPAQRDTQLTGEPVRQRVDELFNPQSLDQALRDFVSPRPNDPAILAPARFEALIRDCARDLHALADAGNQPVLQQAGALLNDEMQLRELLANYRGLLMQA